MEQYSGTQVDKVYQAFLSSVSADDWDEFTYQEARRDWEQLLDNAISWFKFPRVSLAHDSDCFEDELGNDEIQILAHYCVCAWLSRTIASWENIRPLYDERDFSPANMLSKLEEKLSSERVAALRRESNYYRSVNKKPFEYSKLAKND